MLILHSTLVTWFKFLLFHFFYSFSLDEYSSELHSRISLGIYFGIRYLHLLLIRRLPITWMSLLAMDTPTDWLTDTKEQRMRLEINLRFLSNNFNERKPRPISVASKKSMKRISRDIYTHLPSISTQKNLLRERLYIRRRWRRWLLYSTTTTTNTLPLPQQRDRGSERLLLNEPGRGK